MAKISRTHVLDSLVPPVVIPAEDVPSLMAILRDRNPLPRGPWERALRLARNIRSVG